MAKSKVEGISFSELEKSLKQKQFSPVYLFFGEEEFLIAEGIRVLIEHAVEESTASFNLDILYGSDVEARQILSIATSYPMMADRRVVIVKEFEKVANKETLVSYLEKPCTSTALVLVATKTDFRQKVFDVLKKKAILIECKTPYDNELPAWIQNRIKKLGKTISQDASALLHARTGNSLRVVQSEIDKLFIYVEGKKQIDVEDVEEVVGISKQFNIFELEKYLGSMDLYRTLEILERMLDGGESPIGMVVMLTKYFQKILLYHEFSAQRLNEFTLGTKLGIPSFKLKEFVDAARHYSREDVANCFGHLLEADEALKISADPKLTMTLLIYKMLKKVKTLEFQTV